MPFSLSMLSPTHNAIIISHGLLNTMYVYTQVYLKAILKISKRNLKYRDGWMNTLADKVHKQGEHCTFHNIATFHTTILLK